MKIGTRLGNAIQQGKQIPVALKKYKQVPGLWVNLFSLTAAIKDGWSLGSKGKAIMLSKGKTKLIFDKIIPSGDGYICAIDIVPKVESASVLLASGSSIDINKFHQIFNHYGEETLKLTAAAHNVKLIGQLKPCFFCATANARQQPVSKSTGSKATRKGEQIYIDISSIKFKSFGGNQFWLLVLDDCSGKSWSFFLRHKDHQVEVLVKFLLEMKKNNTPVELIQCDNAGENKSLQEAVEKHPTLSVQFEYTPRNSPQYNGKVERRFQFLWRGVRSVLNGAKLPTWLRHGLWAEAGSFIQQVADQLVTVAKKQEGSSYKQFYNKAWPKFETLRPFGMIATITKAVKIQGKLLDKGTPMIYVGPSKDHGNDVHRFLHIKTKKVITTRDATFMNMMYGEWQNLTDPPEVDTVSRVPHPPVEEEAEEVNHEEEEADPGPGNPEPPNPPPPNPAPTPAPAPDANTKLMRAMKQLDSEFLNPEATDYVQQNAQPQAGREDATAALWDDSDEPSLAALTMLDRLNIDLEHALSAVDIAKLKSMKPEDLKPEQYKDAFKKPEKFEQAWNHPCPFQRERWRAAITKELNKMREQAVWKKTLRSKIPRKRRLIKCRWVLEIKRCGTFRA